MKTFEAPDIPQFIAEVDKLGGPFAPAASPLLAGALYRPGSLPASDLDPFSEKYVDAQMQIYREIAGREVDQDVTEMTTFDMEKHATSANAFASEDPSGFAVHYLRLASLVSMANLPQGPRVLDMGAGWGVSSEFLATLGCNVHAVDINPGFIELMRRRATLHRLPITAERGTFESFATDDRFDAILFYECLHHAVRPWEVIENMRNMLRPGGAIILAGEPINNYWADWGLRLDPLSIYCIAKFGWFESGWSQSFLTRCFEQIGMRPSYDFVPNRGIGYLCVARVEEGMDAAAERVPSAAALAVGVTYEVPLEHLFRMTQARGWIYEAPHFLSQGEASVSVPAREGSERFVLQIANYRGKPIQLELGPRGAQKIQVELLPGVNEVPVPDAFRGSEVFLVSDTWVPKLELGTDDGRTLSIHLTGARVEAEEGA